MTDYQYPLTAHALVNAAHASDFNQVKRIVESGIHPDDYGTDIMPALICSTSHGNYEISKYLLDKGADPNKYTESRLSPLKSAANVYSYDVVKLLLDRGADPNYEREGEVALTLACDVTDNKDNKDLVKLLIPITDPKYYQKAYEYSTDEEIRNMIKERAVNIEFVDPVDGFGGPKYKRWKHYNTPPEDPLLRQLWDLVNIFLNEFVEIDPTKAMFYSCYLMSIIDSPNSFYADGKLHLDKNVRYMLGVQFGLKELQEKYSDIYNIFKDYESESESSYTSDEE